MDQPPKTSPVKLTLVPNTGTGLKPAAKPSEFASENFNLSRLSRLRDRGSERADSGCAVGGAGGNRPDAPAASASDATDFPRFRDLRRERDAIIDAAGPVVPKREP
jgi:hypothetical protein